MSIRPNDPADFTPSMGDFTELKPFRFWCQKVLPLVYDDSLSYYELLCKVVDYLNKTMEDVDTMHTDVANLHQAYVELQSYVNDYFDNLDVQQEIDNKLDAMAQDGSLSELISPFIPNIVKDWLNEHITPTTPAIDNSLTVSGAGADSKVVGDLLKNVLFISTNNATEILANSDLNDCTDNCSYICYTEATANTLTNCPPVRAGFRLLPIKTSIPRRMYQIILPNNDDHIIYRNRISDTEWTDWKEIANSTDITSIENALNELKEKVLFLSTDNATEIIANSDLNDCINDTSYICYTETIANTLINCPLVQAGFRLIPIKTSIPRRMYQIILPNNDDHIMYRNKISDDSWNQWKEISNNTDFDTIYDIINTIKDGIQFNYVGKIVHEFTSKEEYRTNIILNPSKKYKIISNNPILDDVTIYGLQDTDNYKKLNSWTPECILQVVGTERYLTLYNLHGTSQDIDLSVYELPDKTHLLNYVNEIYYVNKNEGELGTYTSLTQCLYDLKDNENPKTIYIEGGDYNIFQEYIDANIPVYTGNNPAEDYFDYCVFVPKNTHIIGRGLVRLKWMPSISDGVTIPQSKTVSPLNLAGSCVIENIEIHCKNGRYCIHDDALKKEEYNDAIKEIKNVKCYKYANDSIGNTELGASSVVGFGANRSMTVKYTNCIFDCKSTGYAFYGHNENVVDEQTILEWMSSKYILENCVLNSINQICLNLQNTVTNYVHILFDIINCYLSGSILLTSTNNSDLTRRNSFDLTLVKSGTPTITIHDPNNQYTPKIYN